MYTSKSGSLWMCLHWYLNRKAQESCLDVNLSAIPTSHALVHITEQSWTMQTELLLGKAEPVTCSMTASLVLQAV